MTPLEELPEEMPTEAPQTDCESVKKEWDTASKTGRVSAELMQKALECQLVPEDKVKGMPTGEQSMPPAPTREDNPLAADDEEDKELGMAELTMADTPIEWDAKEVVEEVQSPYVQDKNGNWVYEGVNTPEDYTPTPNPGSYVNDDVVSTPRDGYIPWTVNGITKYVKEELLSQKYGLNDNTLLQAYYSKYPGRTWIDQNDPLTQAYMKAITGSGGEDNTYDKEGTGRIINSPNYFGQYDPNPPEGMGNMEWRYKYNYGMGSNAFNPESFYFNPDDKGNAGQSSSPYSRIGNRGNMTPEIVQSNKPFYDERGINKYTNLDELKFKQRTMNMAEVAMPQGQENPMGASVDQTQGQGQEIDEQVQEQLKEAIMEAGFNVVDIGMSPEGKILITVGQFEDSYIENAQYFEVDFELAEPMKCGKRFKAIAVTPGMYKAKDGTLVELSSEQLQNIAGLFRNKPLVLVDHDLARPESTHEGRNVGYIEDSWYDGDYDAVIYKGALTEDLDLAGIAGSSIKLSHGKTPMGRHIALIPKCIPGRACYAPQDPNAVILENAQKIGEDKMNINPQQAAALKKELEHINKQKESMIDGIIKSEIEAGQLKSNIFDRTRELWKSDVGVLLEMASAKTETKETPSTKSKDEGKKELSLAKKIEKGEIDPEDALVFLIENDPFFKA